MKKTKNVVARIIATSLAVMMLFSGCGKTRNESTATNEGNTSNRSAVSQSGNTSTDQQEEITVTMMVGEAATQEFPEQNYVVDYIKKKFNINLELQPIPGSDFETKISTVLATNNMPDIMGGITIETINKYATTGMLLNLSDYKEIAKDYFNIMYGDERAGETKKFEINGSLYGFQKCEYNRIPVSSMIAIRTDLLEEQSISTPTTFDEYYDALLKIKEKHPDMYGFSSRNGTNYLLGQFAYSLGTGGFPLFQTTRGTYYEPKVDAYVYGPTSENFVRVVEFLRKAYADGLLDPDYATMNKDTMFEKLSNGKLMSVYDNNSFVARVYNPALAEIDANAKFDILEPLKNTDGEIRSYRYEKDWPNNNTIISSQTKYPERIVELLNWMYSEEGIKVTNFGEEGVDYDVVDGKVVTKQSLIDENKGASDIVAAIQGRLAAGLQGMAQYVDEGLNEQITDPIMVEQGKKINEWTEKEEISYWPQYPFFDEEEKANVTNYETILNNIFNQEIDGFITGKTSMEQWNDLVKKLQEQGADKLEELYNQAYSRIK